MSDMSNHPAGTKSAVIHRMVMPNHTCPYGLKVIHLLKRAGYEVEDHHLTTREETDAFKAQHGVATTPQIFISDQRIGGHDDLRRFLGKRVADPKATSYQPVIALFSVTALTALAASHAVTGTFFTLLAAEWFIGFSMVVLALLKLQNIESFATMFLNYDLLAKRWVPYSYIYPFAEGLAGVLMISGALTWLSVPIALFIATVGAVSVFKAVYIDKRELKCACVGGSSNVPLGFISLTENLMMIAMAVWMALAALGLATSGVHTMNPTPTHTVEASSPAREEALSTTAYKAAHHEMMAAMNVPYTGMPTSTSCAA
jgi:glutaredoxin